MLFVGLWGRCSFVVTDDGVAVIFVRVGGRHRTGDSITLLRCHLSFFRFVYIHKKLKYESRVKGGRGDAVAIFVLKVMSSRQTRHCPLPGPYLAPATLSINLHQPLSHTLPLSIPSLLKQITNGQIPINFHQSPHPSMGMAPSHDVQTQTK
jgi:hypothetical protein